VLRTCLEANGFEVSEAVNGAEALRQLLACEVLPSLILLDGWMPVLSGYEFIDLLEKHGRFSRIAVVLVTGLDISTPPALVRGVLQKPFNCTQLIDLVNELCRSSHPLPKHTQELSDA
jgi:two-component system alkaline phosphatase synthesis response regulator PhoP